MHVYPAERGYHIQERWIDRLKVGQMDKDGKLFLICQKKRIWILVGTNFYKTITFSTVFTAYIYIHYMYIGSDTCHIRFSETGERKCYKVSAWLALENIVQ